MRELARLQVAPKPVKRPALIVPDIRDRIDGVLDRLEGVLHQDPERGRGRLLSMLGERIKLQPDESGKFLWAEHSLGLAPLLPVGNNAGSW